MDSLKSIDKSEVACGALLIALGLFVIRESTAWEYMTRDGPGPGFFPLWIGLALVVLSALYLAAHIYDVVRGEPVHHTDWSGAPLVIAGWAAFMAVIALIKPIGLIAALFLMAIILVRVIFRRSLVTALAVGAGSAFGFWLLFVQLLNLRLPAGPWGF